MENSRPAPPEIVTLRSVGTWHAVRIPAFLALFALGIAAVYLALGILRRSHPDLVHPELFRFLDMSEEANLPTWFSALLWQAAAMLAFFVAQRHRSLGWPYAGYWFGMVPLFLFLSLDETGKIHEAAGDVISSRIGDHALRPYTYSWVIFGLGLVAAVGLVYLRLLSRLGRGLAGLLVLSAALFLLGAVVIESVSASVHKGSIAGFPPGLSFARAIALEETLEMLGAILLIHVLLRVLAGDDPPYLTRAEPVRPAQRPRSAATQLSDKLTQES